jgi:hypothetical protein
MVKPLVILLAVLSSVNKASQSNSTLIRAGATISIEVLLRASNMSAIENKR